MTAQKNRERQFFIVFQDILKTLPDRSQDIVGKRFGVLQKDSLTLQAIGDEYGITRERVRQIVQSGLKNAQKAQHRAYTDARDALCDFIAAHHGITSEEKIMAAFAGDAHTEKGAIRFLIEGIPEIAVMNVKKYPVHPRVVTLRDFDVNHWHDVHKTVKKFLKEKETTHTEEELHAHVAQKHDIPEDALAHYLFVSREIDQNPFDKWGLVTWDEISPRGIREKVSLIMKEQKKPMHFTEIAEAIDYYGLGKNGRKSHPQTVHNELIRDDRFVLVGRGVYTLHSDDYVEGTVKDVIENVLQNAPEDSLTVDEIIDRVLQKRFVKPSTIKVNLNAIAKKFNKKVQL